jgi:hypothetical protein
MNPLLKQAFEKAAEANYWSDADSLSGPGSNMEQTRVIREQIPVLLEKYGVKTMLDAPCGDLFWMKTILPVLMQKGIQYQGADIVTGIVEKNRIHFAASNALFHTIDLTRGPIPKADLIFTRDCFIHLSYHNIYAILRNYKKSGARYLLVSTYTYPQRKNFNVDGFYLYGRMLNLEKFPFYLGKPAELIVEGCTENDGINADKSLGLWELENINLVKMKLFILISLFPYNIAKTYENSIHFFTRLKNFIKRKLSI